MRLRLVALIVAGLALTGACGSDDPGDTSSPASVGEDGRPDCVKAKPCKVSREQFGAQWPFTVDRGVLRCEIVAPTDNPTLDSRKGLVLEANGKTYAINLPALRVAAEKGWRPTEEILPEDPPSALGFVVFGLRTCP